MLLARYPRLRDRLALFAAAILEFLGYHQILAVERFVAMFQVRRKRGNWGQMRRAGIGGLPPRSEPFEPEVVTHTTDNQPGAPSGPPPLRLTARVLA
jgi:hypothetical protein